MERKHFYLPPQLIARLQAYSKEKGVRAGEIVRLAIDAFLKKNGA